MRRAAANVLNFGPAAKAAVNALIEAMNDSDSGIRVIVALSLGYIGADARDAIPALIKATNHPKAGGRWAAVQAIGLIGAGADAVPALIERLSDPADFVRSSAAETLGKLGPVAKAAVPALTESAKDMLPGLRLYSTIALKRIAGDDDAALVLLINGLKDADEEVRRAAMALAQSAPCYPSRPAEALLRFVQELRHGNAAASVVYSLGRIGAAGNKDVVGPLLEALKDPEVGVRSAAASALGDIGAIAKGAAPALETAMRDKDAAVRRAATQAFKKISREAAIADAENRRWLDLLTLPSVPFQPSCAEHSRSIRPVPVSDHRVELRLAQLGCYDRRSRLPRADPPSSEDHS